MQLVHILTVDTSTLLIYVFLSEISGNYLHFLLLLQTERIKSVMIVCVSYDNGNYQFK